MQVELFGNIMCSKCRLRAPTLSHRNYIGMLIQLVVLKSDLFGLCLFCVYAVLGWFVLNWVYLGLDYLRYIWFIPSMSLNRKCLVNTMG